MNAAEIIATILMTAGVVAFVAGTAGLLRFPDVFTRLHALTKADNLGLGLVLLGLWIRQPELVTGLKFLAIWVLVMTASTTACHLVARRALERGVKPWRKEP